MRVERERNASLTHPQLVESLYAERDSARSELSDVLAERDGLQSMLTQQGREHIADRARIAAAIRGEMPADDDTEGTRWRFGDGSTIDGGDVFDLLERLLRVVEGGP